MPVMTDIERRLAQLIQSIDLMRREAAGAAAAVQQVGAAVSQRSGQAGSLLARVEQVRQGMQNITPQ